MEERPRGRVPLRGRVPGDLETEPGSRSSSAEEAEDEERRAAAVVLAGEALADVDERRSFEAFGGLALAPHDLALPKAKEPRPPEGEDEAPSLVRLGRPSAQGAIACPLDVVVLETGVPARRHRPLGGRARVSVSRPPRPWHYYNSEGGRDSAAGLALAR